MKMKRQIAAAAIWLLKVFKVPESNPALAGDLTEEYSGSQRAAWLWRQVLAAIAFTIAKGIFSHKLLTIGTLIAGEVAVSLSSLVLMKGLYSPGLMRFLMAQVPHWMLPFNLFRCGSMIGFMIGG